MRVLKTLFFIKSTSDNTFLCNQSKATLPTDEGFCSRPPVFERPSLGCTFVYCFQVNSLCRGVLSNGGLVVRVKFLSKPSFSYLFISYSSLSDNARNFKRLIVQTIVRKMIVKYIK